MKNYPTISWTIILIILFTNSACKKFIEIDLPKDELTTEKVFADSADANAALVGIYARMHSGLTFGSGLLTIYPGMSSDELLQTASDDNRQFYSNTLLPTNSTVGGIWSAGYSYIYTQNACIEGVANSHTLTDSQKAVFTAEARCLRAFIYFYLVNLYGPVPLVLTTDYNTSRTLPRASEEAVYKQIVEDLTYAKSVLPLKIDGNTRVNKDVATALLARVYLFRGNYTGAITEANSLIESNRYGIAATPNDVFLPESTETIWGLLPVSPSRATWEGFNLIPSSSSRVPAYIISDDLFNAFDVNDLRKIQWIRFNTVNGVKYPYPYKYKMRVAGSTTLENYVMLRFTEQYLIGGQRPKLI
ncbi:RagB/SusD family nutrient uptake outer membrane protein [Pedobacter sp. NJ-S-72]